MIQSLKSNRKRLKLAFWLCAYTFTVIMLGTTLPTPLYSVYQSHLGFSEFMITIIFAIYAAGVIAALVLFGKWSDQVGRRPLLFVGVFFSAFSTILFLIGADSLGLILAGRVFSGLSAGIFTGIATTMIIELGMDKKFATMIATAAIMVGLGLGPLLSGLLLQYAPLPLNLSYWVHLGLIIIGFFGLWYTPETVNVSKDPRFELQKLNLPSAVRTAFIPAAISGFAGFAVLGFFSSVAPSVLGQLIHLSNHALTGGIVFIIFISSLFGQYLVKWMPSQKSIILGCIVLIVGASLVGLGVAIPSLVFISVGAIISGCGQGLVFGAGMGNIIASSSEDQRGEVVSLYFVIMYVAISIPVIGVGLTINTFGLRLAGIMFSIGMVGLTCIALFILLSRYIRGRIRIRQTNKKYGIQNKIK